MFGMELFFQNPGDQFFGIGAVFRGPLDDPGGGPFKVSLMTFGHVFFEGGEGAWDIVSFVRGDPTSLEKDLHTRCS